MIHDLDDREWVTLAQLARSGVGVDLAKILITEVSTLQQHLTVAVEISMIHQLQGRILALTQLMNKVSAAPDMIGSRGLTA